MRSMPACKPSPPHRDRRGVRYRLASLLMIGVLAKLAGQDSSRGMAHWAKLRTHELSQLFHLKRESMPHYSTWSRVLGHGVEANEVEQIVGRFFAQATKAAQRKRGSIHLAMDGKTLRGTIPLGETDGVHLLAVYLPQQGVVLAQMNVEHKGREITFAPTLLSQIDLRGVVVSGDAMFDRRSLSSKIVQAHGDYLWTVKENEKGFYQDIEVLFQPHRKQAGTSAPPNDFRYAQTVEKGHGRIEKRTITVSSMLADYSPWAELAQVFKLESQRTDALGSTKTEVRYGVTSLPVYLADPKRLLALSRGNWTIEIVQSQLTKPNLFAGRGGGDHITDLHLVIGDYHAINQQLNELALLLKSGLSQALLHTLTERFNGLGDGRELVVDSGWVSTS